MMFHVPRVGSMIRSGVPEPVAITVSGQKTIPVFDHYERRGVEARNPTAKNLLHIFFDGFVKSSKSMRVNFPIKRSTCRTLNDFEMQHNQGVGLFTKPSFFTKKRANH
jgi:hypothetical protein